MTVFGRGRGGGRGRAERARFTFRDGGLVARVGFFVLRGGCGRANNRRRVLGVLMIGILIFCFVYL